MLPNLGGDGIFWLVGEAVDSAPAANSPKVAGAEPDTGREVVQDSLEEAQEQVRHLLVALEHRSVTGQATGILMERYGLPADEAFGMLVRLSQDRNEKLYAMAQRLITTGDLPGLPAKPAKAARAEPAERAAPVPAPSPADLFPPRRAQASEHGSA